MSLITRNAKAALAASILSIALVSACTPHDEAGPADTGTKTAEAPDGDGVPVIEGLEGDRAQASYMVGMQIGKSLEAMKGEVDEEVLFQAIRDSLEGKPPLLNPEQAELVASRFGERMASKLEAERAEQGRKNAEAGKQFMAENGKKEGVVTTDSGLQYQVIAEGKGAKPKAQDVVRVHYKGTLLDGSTFDDSTARGEPVVFPLDQVVPGWSEGLTLMPVGSKYRFWIPGELGYGEMGTPGGPIGPNQTLVFEVELLGIEKPAAGE